MAATQQMAPRDNGAPEYKKFLHPMMTKNYGKWKYHEKVRPGILKHVADSGDEMWTIRCGSARTLSVDKVRDICEIADKFCEGHLRFTSRNNIEFQVTKEEDIEPLAKEITGKLGFPIGGTGHSVSNMMHTQGWLHCNLPGTDAAGAVKALMDELYDDFVDERLPHRVKLSTSCCSINCGGQADIVINLQHHHPPTINHANMKICELPKVVAICPVAAIRPQKMDGKDSLEVVGEKCMYCGACHGQCPSMEIRDPKTDTLSIFVGGKSANTRSGPQFMKLATWGIPNNPPRWPEVSAAVKTILEAYRTGAKDWERIADWIERIGWKRFFEETGFKFTKYHIDTYRFARTTFNTSAQVRL